MTEEITKPGQNIDTVTQETESKPIVSLIDASTINYGDQVVFYESMVSMKLQTLSKEGFFQNRFGYFGHSEIVGKRYGEKVFNVKGNAFVFLLRPDAVLLTDTLAHKTQILYQADISMVIAKMNILPGSIVVESGTGSASLSSSLARTVQDTGFLYTFEFNEERAANGKAVLSAQGLNNFKVIWRDVIQNGFLPLEGEEQYNLKEGTADAVFLDLPRPFEAVGHARKVLKRGGRICCFSPCIEQVMKNCEEMRAQRFVQITTMEVIQRTFEKRDKVLQSAFAVEVPLVVNNKRKRVDVEGKDQEDAVDKDDVGEDEVADGVDNDKQEEISEVDSIKKQVKLNDSENKELPEVPESEEGQVDNIVAPAEGSEEAAKVRVHRQPPPRMVRPTITKQVLTSGPKEIKGHTGYLSFGILM